MLQFDEMRVELLKEQQREIVAAPWTMWTRLPAAKWTRRTMVLDLKIEMD